MLFFIYLDSKRVFFFAVNGAGKSFWYCILNENHMIIRKGVFFNC